MCLALPIIAALAGGALSAGGTMVNNRAQDQQAADIAKARNDVLRETMMKNDAIAAETRNRFDQNTDQYSQPKFDAAAADANTARSAPIEAAIAPPPVAAPISGSAPDVVRTDLAKTMSDTMAKGKAQAQALGKVGSYGDTWFNAGAGNTAAGRDIGVQNDFASGNLGIMPYLQDFAQVAATKPISPLGSIMQGVGSAIGSIGGGPMGSAMASAPSFLMKKPVPKQVMTGWGGPR